MIERRFSRNFSPKLGRIMEPPRPQEAAAFQHEVPMARWMVVL
jgi:hypothetical protein